MPEFHQLARAILVFLLVLGAVTWILSLVRVNLSIRYLPGRKNEMFNKMLAIVKGQQFNVKTVDPGSCRIVTEGIVKVTDLGLVQLWGNRLVFQVTQFADQEVKLRVYSYASFLFLFYGYVTFLFSRTSLTKSEQAKLIRKDAIDAVLDPITREDAGQP